MSSLYNTPWIKHKLVVSIYSNTETSLAISTLAIWCRVVQSRDVSPHKNFDGIAMSGLAFSVAPIKQSFRDVHSMVCKQAFTRWCVIWWHCRRSAVRQEPIGKEGRSSRCPDGEVRPVRRGGTIAERSDGTYGKLEEEVTCSDTLCVYGLMYRCDALVDRPAFAEIERKNCALSFFNLTFATL